MTTLTNEAQNTQEPAVLQARFRSSLKDYGLNGSNYVANQQVAQFALSPEVYAVLSDPQYDDQSRASRDGKEVSLPDFYDILGNAVDADALDDMIENVWAADDLFERAERDESAGRQKLVDANQYDVSKEARWRKKQERDATGAPVGTRFSPKAYVKHERLIQKARRYYGIPEAFDAAGRVRSGFMPLVLTPKTAEAKQTAAQSTASKTKMAARAQLRALAKAKRSK